MSFALQEPIVVRQAQPSFRHVPVLMKECIELLRVRAGGCYCDATVGGGGHARAILQASAPDGRLLGIDQDPDALAHTGRALADLGERLVLRRGSFADLGAIGEGAGFGGFDGILADLGVSSYQLDTPERGFSLAADGPLDMRMNPAADVTARSLIASLDEEALARLLRDYGEERRARRIARAIKSAERAGRLDTTGDLRDLVSRTMGPSSARRRARIHPATRTFQALRIAVNDELGALERLLDQVVDLLHPGGIVAIIAFHSLEDRAVKRRFKRLSQPAVRDPWTPQAELVPEPSLKRLTQRPIRSGEAEVSSNPRARSARLRAAEKLA